ncbi:MAG: AraC family transcriptional regulator [Microbacteriaceae bacterium]|nr:AraC family transcriptional regulator [Microbacteriaceae bacterium]
MTSAQPAIVRRSDALFDERYRAMSARDSRFDGQFITGVHSTGIYCRPSCPAMTPKRSNVVFYRTAAAAHEAGLRACKRCLPDAVPGSPDWNLRDDVAARAMRLIADGTVEREGVTGLASRLGYTTRHLNRVLVGELGAGPLALSRAHRAQTARTLLSTTDLSIADVAFAAGFSSIRQFNDTVQAVYQTTPTLLRGVGRRTAGGLAASGATSITLRLPARAPFDGAGLLTFFANHAAAGIESGDSEAFSRSVRLPHGIASLEVRLDGPSAVSCSVRLENVADLATLVSRVRRLFDLDADSEAIDAALASDPALAPSVQANRGIRIPGSLDPEESLFRTMIGQQVSVAAARTVIGTVARGLSATPGLFPTATEIAERGHEVLRGPVTRVAAIIGAARAIADGRLTIDVGMSTEELTRELVALPGVGPWTAGYVATRVLGSPDVLLTTDLVLLTNATRLGLPPTAKGLAAYGERWAPWRSYAGAHLWRLSGADARRTQLGG